MALKNRTFWILLASLVAGAVLRSALATRFDSFTQDEGYHTLAGVSYVKRADFRINPEHPPLVKFWVGAIISATGFNLSPFREMHDKNDERDFAEEDVYQHNNPDSVQRRARAAMWGLNALLLAGFTLALRRAFNSPAALCVLAVLVIDPTVAAHMPLVLTDLPISLLCATAVVLATRAFRRWEWPDLVATSVALGLALATKHSAPVFVILLAVAGCVLAWTIPQLRPGERRILRLTKVVGVLLGALVILWGFYLFRFAESPGGSTETFNRPLAEKIADLQSPVHRFVLTHATTDHLLPRAYIWGFADTIRAGLEGRVDTRLFYGHVYFGSAPFYFFPGILAAKLPLGSLFLVLVGIVLCVKRSLPEELHQPALAVLLVCLGFLAVIARGATYGGMRHAMPAAVLLYIFAGLAVYAALVSRSAVFRCAVALALAATAVSALPVIRPYEYYNEIIGTQNAYLCFNDEGLDAEQRGRDVFQYYFKYVKPAGEIPYLYYTVPLHELDARGMDYVGHDVTRDAARMSDPTLTGTIFIGRWFLSKKPYWNPAALFSATPAARFGNLFVYRGTFYLPGLVASDSYFAGVSQLYAAKPDAVEAERLFRQSVQLDPSAYFVYIELGNLALARGSHDEALSAYKSALQYAPPILAQPIVDQIRSLSTTPLPQVRPLRDPMIE